MMENLKELIRKAGHSTVPAAWLMNDAPLGGGKSKLERLTAFVEALLAEIAKENEPVYAFRRKGLDNFCTCDKRRFDELSQMPSLFEMRVFYTFPPSTEQIENRVAEACAKLCRNRSAVGGNRIADDIEDGAWMEYLK